MATSATQIATSENYISTVTFLNGMSAIHEPEVERVLFERFPGQGIMRDFETLMGRTQAISSPTFYWLEEDRIHVAATANALVADPGAGNSVTITLPAAEHNNSGASTYPRVGDIVEFNNKVQGQITAKNTGTANAHTITIQPLRAAENIGAIAAGDKIFVVSNAWAEGTGQPAGITPIPLKFQTHCQIIKDSYEVSGSEVANKSWVQVKNKNGGTGYSWYLKGERDTFMRFQTKVELAMLLQNQADANYTLGGQPVKTMKGLLPSIREGGNSFDSTTFDLTTFENIIKLLDKQKGDFENLWYNGIDLQMRIDNLFKNSMKNDEMLYSPFGGKRERMVTFGFKAFQWGSYQFYFKTLQAFNEENLMGTAGTSYPQTGFIVPAGKTSYLDSNDQSRKTAYSCRMLYKELNGHSRKYEHWITGGGTATPNKTDDIDTTKMHYRCEKGFCAMGTNRFAIIE